MTQKAKTIYKKIQLNDNNPTHQELSIYREGDVYQVNIKNPSPTPYASLHISAHHYTALFHYGLVERFNSLTFISETNNGLDSWDEAILPHSQLKPFLDMLKKELESLQTMSDENVMIGWIEEPEKISFWRKIKIEQFKAFVLALIDFTEEALEKERDLEFVL